MSTLGSLSWVDYVVFVSVLAISVAIGIYQAYRHRKNKSVTDFLLGGRQLRWLPVGLSILVTFQSSILYLGIPAEIYTKGTSYMLFHIGMAFSVLAAAFIFIPLLYPLRLTSTNEYLERRFESQTCRVIGWLLGMLNMVLYMGAVIFAPSLAMEAISGIPAWVSIVTISAIAIIYTSLGGLRAVVWSDVFQCCIMICGLLGVLIEGYRRQGGFGEVWRVNSLGGRLDYGSLSADPRVRHSLWGLVIGGTLTWLANIGVTQNNVQRFSSVPTLRAAQAAVLMSLPGFVILGVLASFVGMIIYSHFATKGCDPLEADVISNPNQLMTLYLQEVFSFLPGFTGLFIAALFSACLSTVSSTITSLATLTWEDLLKPRLPAAVHAHATTVLRVLVAVFGVVGMCMAFISMSLGGPATQIALSFFGASGGPLLGMFLLGSLFPQANWKGASVGSLVALALCLWIAIGSYTLPPRASLPPAPSYNCTHDTHSNGHHTNGHHTNGHHTNGHVNGYSSDNNNTATTVNTTETTQVPETRWQPLDDLYRVSYLWYSTIGIIVTLSLGLLVSLATGFTPPGEVDSELLLFTRWRSSSFNRAEPQDRTDKQDHIEPLHMTNDSGSESPHKSMTNRVSPEIKKSSQGVDSLNHLPVVLSSSQPAGSPPCIPGSGDTQL